MTIDANQLREVSAAAAKLIKEQSHADRERKAQEWEQQEKAIAARVIANLDGVLLNVAREGAKSAGVMTISPDEWEPGSSEQGIYHLRGAAGIVRDTLLGKGYGVTTERQPGEAYARLVAHW